MGKFYEAACAELEVYIRHLAWLNATPDGDKISRFDWFEANGYEAVYPDCDADYILTYLQEIGMSLGEQPLNFSEINAYQNVTGIDLQSWEARIIKRLSVAYLSELANARSPDRESAWDDAPRYMHVSYMKSMKAKASIRRLTKE